MYAFSTAEINERTAIHRALLPHHRYGIKNGLSVLYDVGLITLFQRLDKYGLNQA